MPLDAQVVAAALQEQLTELNGVGAGVGVRLGDGLRGGRSCQGGGGKRCVVLAPGLRGREGQNNSPNRHTATEPSRI